MRLLRERSCTCASCLLRTRWPLATVNLPKACSCGRMPARIPRSAAILAAHSDGVRDNKVKMGYYLDGFSAATRAIGRARENGRSN